MAINMRYMALSLITASLLLVGCSTTKTIKEYVYVRDTLPPSLLADCPGYDGPLVDNGDLADAYITERQGRVACNADKEALREWDAKRMAEPRPSGK